MIPTRIAPVVIAVLLAALFAVAERARLRQDKREAARLDASGLLVLWPLIFGVFFGISCAEGLPVFFLLMGGVVVWLLTTLCDFLNWRLLTALPGLILGAVVAVQGGVGISSVKLPFMTDFVALGWAGPLVTVVWLATCAMVFGWNAGLLEIPLGVAGLAGLTMYGISLLQPEMVGPGAQYLAGMLGVLGLVLVPFARYLSRHTARAGSVTVGFVLGGLSVLGALKHTAFLVALLPLLVIGVPIFSVGYAYIQNLRHGGRSLTMGERRQNVDMLLLTQGYTRRQVVVLALAGTAYLCALALLLVWLIEVSFLVKALLLAAALVLGLATSYVILRLLPRPLRVERSGDRAISLLGVRVHTVGWEAALAQVEEFLGEDHPHMIVTSDSSTVMRAQEDQELREIMNQADLVTADGAGVVLAARLLNLPLEERVSGCDLVGRLCEAAARQHRSVYLLGGEPGVAQEAAAVLQRQVPGLCVAGTHHGYFNLEEEALLVREIAAAGPGVLFVALGIPRQEKWIKQHLEELGTPVCIGVGGTFDVISGRKKRAPVWMQRCGLEWAYRTWKEPWRLPRLAALPRIVWLTFRELLRR